MSVEWLTANASPVIQYRTQLELMEVSEDKLQNNLADVLALSQTQKRLTLLKYMNYNRTHGSDSTHLENILPMLCDFGLHYGIDAFNCEIKSLDEISAIVTDKNYDKLIAYPFLLRSKFPLEGLLVFAIERIDTIYDFTKNMDFDIYDDISDYKGVPKNFQDRPIIKPDIACGWGKIRLPLISI